MGGNHVQVWGEGRGRRTIAEQLIDQLTGIIDQRLQEEAPVGVTKVPRGPSCGRWVGGELLSQMGGGGRGRKSGWAGHPSVLQHGLVALEHALGHLGGSALQGDLRRRGEVRGQKGFDSTSLQPPE